MNHDTTEDQLRWEFVTPGAEWEGMALVRQALERLALDIGRCDETIPAAGERVIRF